MAYNITDSSSGIDVQSIVDQMIEAARAPETLWKKQESALDIQAKALTDIRTKVNSLVTSVDNLKDFFGTINARSAISSNTNLVTATAANNTPPATHIVTVSQLASVASSYSRLYASTESIAAGTQFTIQVGSDETKAKTISFSSTTTLSAAAGKINDLGIGVIASVVQDVNGSRLSLVSKTSGTAGNITIANDTTGSTFTQLAARNAQLTVDGVPIESSSNTVSGAIAGVTLQLTGASEGTNVTLSVGPNSDAVTQAVQSFVDNYNGVVAAINDQFKYDTSSESSGALAGDATLRDLQSMLLRDLGNTPKGTSTVQTLRSMGIQMENDGTLTVNSSVLSSTISSHYADMQSFLQDVSTGFATKMAKDLDSFTDVLTGPINVELSSIAKNRAMYENEISDLEASLLLKQQVLTAQFANIDALLRQSAVTQQQIAAQTSYLNTSSSTK